MPAPGRPGSTAIRRAARRIGRSEGLALASLVMFRDCEFSMWPSRPLRADASILADFAEAKLVRGFQVSDDNPLPGVAGRADLLRRLGRTVMAAPEIFGREDTPRPGGLFDHLAVARATTAGSPRRPSSRSCSTHLGPIWPSRLTLGGIALGDCWRHSALKTDDETERPRAAAQALAMARLFADRAAAMGGHRGHRHRRPHRPRRIPQRRPVHRHRRAGAARSRPRRSASTPSIPSWSSSGARSPWPCSTAWPKSCARG